MEKATRWTPLFAVTAAMLSVACESQPGTRTVPVTTTPEHEIGGSAEADVMFGDIQDAAFLPSGELLVLDRMNSILTMFDVTGRPAGRIGAEGEGPGEWLWPSSVDVSKSGLVRILSQGLARIHVYEIRAESLALLEEIRVPFLPRDLCTLNERILVLGLHQGLTIHEVDKGQVVSSFGPPIERPPELLGQWDGVTAEWTADGRLVCDEEHGLIIHAPLKLPDVTAYDAFGNRVWQARMDGWSQGRWERAPGGPIHAAPDPSTGQSSRLASVALLSPDKVIVQFFNTRRPGYAGADKEIESRVLDRRTGAVCGLSDEAPQLLAVLGSRAAWAVESLAPGLTVGHIEGGACESAPAL